MELRQKTGVQFGENLVRLLLLVFTWGILQKPQHTHICMPKATTQKYHLI